MALTKDVLTQYFEKSERLNALQKRIQVYTTFLKRSYDDKTWKKLRLMSVEQRLRVQSFSKEASLPLQGATLMFRWGIDSDQPACPLVCRFFLSTGSREKNSWYDLTEQQLPSKFVEPVYELLPELLELMKQADKELPSEIEQEILAYLQ